MRVVVPACRSAPRCQLLRSGRAQHSRQRRGGRSRHSRACQTSTDGHSMPYLGARSMLVLRQPSSEVDRKPYYFVREGGFTSHSVTDTAVIDLYGYGRTTRYGFRNSAYVKPYAYRIILRCPVGVASTVDLSCAGRTTRLSRLYNP